MKMNPVGTISIASMIASAMACAPEQDPRPKEVTPALSSSSAVVNVSQSLAISSWGSGRLDAFVRGRDNGLWHAYYTGSWSAWESLGGTLTSDPAAVSWGPNRIDVFARGTTNELLHKYYSNGWSGWENLGGTLASGPAAASWAGGRLDVFAQGTTHEVFHKYYSNGWSGWENLGGNVVDSPAATAWGSGRLDVFAQGATGELFHKYYSNGWSSWENLDGQLTSGPAVASWGSGRLDVFARGTTGELFHKYYSNGWSGWENLQGGLSSAPAAVSSGTGRIDIIVLGTDGLVYQKSYQQAWSTWSPVGFPGQSTSTPRIKPCGNGTVIAEGVTYYDCSQKQPAVHVVTIDRSVSYAQMRLLAKSNSAGKLDLTQISTLGRDSDAIVAVNGYTWDGDKGYGPGTGTPLTTTYRDGVQLSSNSTGLDEALMGFQQSTSGIFPKRIPKGPTQQTDSAPYRYTMYGSNTSVLAGGVCHSEGPTQAISLVGYSPTQVVFLSTATGAGYPQSDLCPVLADFGVTEAVSQDGNTARGLYIGGSLDKCVNPLEGLDHLAYGDERHIAYGLALVPNLPPGSYRQTCRACTSTATSLSCRRCKDSGTGTKQTSISLPCGGDVANCNGSLTCGSCP